VASINVCTDQLLVAIAAPSQIAALGPSSRDMLRYWSPPDADRYPRVSGHAEDILVLKPDIVLAGRSTKLATREFLKTHGVRVEEFEPARSLEDVRAQIVRVGRLTGNPERALNLIAKIDSALERARASAGNGMRVLALSRRGWLAGSESLIGDLLRKVGLANAAEEMGMRRGGFATLEAIIAAKPDFVLVSKDEDFAEDQGRAFLLHPAIEKLYPRSRRIMVPDRLTVCAGPMLPEAIDRLATEIERVSRSR
jgi:iron complex transport system substrate-binding protein